MRLACHLGEVVWVTSPGEKQIVECEQEGLRSRESTSCTTFQYSVFKLSSNMDK